MAAYVLFDHELYPADAPLVNSGSRGLRYGDGLFETMKVRDDRILLWAFHAERLWKGLGTLGFDIPFTPASLQEDVLLLCARNGHVPLARVRLNVFRGDGPGDTHYLIETFPLVVDAALPLEIKVYPDGRKAFDVFANLKSNNYLVYLRAADWARAQGLGECLVLNGFDRVADGSTSNVFWVRAGVMYTPPLSEACVAGVMRRYLLEKLTIREEPLSIDELSAADEVFLTNAIRGIRPVSRFGSVNYRLEVSAELQRWLETNMG